MYIVVSNCLNESHVNKLYSFIIYIHKLYSLNNPLNHSWRNLAICRRTHTHQLMSYELVYTSIHSSINYIHSFIHS